jgi:hypothetical protein
VTDESDEKRFALDREQGCVGLRGDARSPRRRAEQCDLAESFAAIEGGDEPASIVTSKVPSAIA